MIRSETANERWLGIGGQERRASVWDCGRLLPLSDRAGASKAPEGWRSPKPRGRPPGGFVLVAVLVVVMLSSMVALSLLFHQRAEETAAASGGAGDKAWAAAMSGVTEAMRVAGRTATDLPGWEENPDLFRERLCFDDGSERWYFTIYSMGDPDLQTVRYGLADEAGKLNVNTATEAMLSALPKVTPYLVQGLLDFLDADNTPLPEGAEQEYYDALANSYVIRNGPLATLEELLLVRGFTPDVFYGEDSNLNFQLDLAEDDAEEQFPPDNKDGKLDAGLRPYLTVCSYDVNEDAQRRPRINLSDAQSAIPEADFPAPVAAYIAALRRNNVTLTHPVELLEAKGKFKDEKGQEGELESGVGKAELPSVLDRLTTTTERRLPGLINVNTAPAPVLQTLPDIDEARAASIVAARRNLRPEQLQTPAWLYEENLVDAELFKKIAPLVTVRSLQFHFHVVGYGVPSTRFRVLEVIVDLANSKPAIVYLRDITKLGLPFKIEVPTEQPPDSEEIGPSLTRSTTQEKAGRRTASGQAPASQRRAALYSGANGGGVFQASLPIVSSFPLTPSLSPAEGERVSEGRVRGTFWGSMREVFLRRILSPRRGIRLRQVRPIRRGNSVPGRETTLPLPEGKGRGETSPNQEFALCPPEPVRLGRARHSVRAVIGQGNRCARSDPPYRLVHGKPPRPKNAHWDHESRSGAFSGAEVGRLESRPSELQVHGKGKHDVRTSGTRLMKVATHRRHSPQTPTLKGGTHG